MSLIEHAERELARLGNDADFNESILGAVRAFASYGHSGGSASYAIPVLNDLLQFKNLTPLTDDPDEWMKVEGSSDSDEGLWQSCRRPEAFSEDGGKTYTLTSDNAHETFGRHLYISERKTKTEDEKKEEAPRLGESPVEGYLDEDSPRLRAWLMAEKLVGQVIEEHGLELYQTKYVLGGGSAITKTDQHISHIREVADWLLGEDG